MSESEKFYEEASDFIDRNRIELQLGEAFAKFSFWSAIWASKSGQLVIVLALLGLFYGERAILSHRTTGVLFIAALATAFVVTVLAIGWRLLKFVYKCVRFLVSCAFWLVSQRVL